MPATSDAISTLAVGDHPVTAVFLGTTEFTTSTSAAMTQTVTAVDTTTTVSPHTASVFGESVTFDATVAAVSPSTATPAGTVQFKVDGNNLGSPVTLVNGAATSDAISTLAVGDHTVTAVFTDAGEFNGSTSAPMTQTVTAVDTTTTVSPHAASVFGESVAFDATVTSANPSIAVPAGQVQFLVDGNALGSPVTLDSLGHATSDAISSLAIGDHPVVAVFTDAGEFNGSTSVAVTQTVGAATTTTSVSSSDASSVFGENVTFDANGW